MRSCVTTLDNTSTHSGPLQVIICRDKLQTSYFRVLSTGVRHTGTQIPLQSSAPRWKANLRSNPLKTISGRHAAFCSSKGINSLLMNTCSGDQALNIHNSKNGSKMTVRYIKFRNLQVKPGCQLHLYDGRPPWRIPGHSYPEFQNKSALKSHSNSEFWIRFERNGSIVIRQD